MPILVTTAPKSPRDEQRDRTRRYLVTMAVRLVCFVAAVVLYGVGFRLVAALAVIGSLVLPWVAVIVANAGPKPDLGRPSLYAAATPRELDDPPTPT